MKSKKLLIHKFFWLSVSYMGIFHINAFAYHGTPDITVRPFTGSAVFLLQILILVVHTVVPPNRTSNV